jgi:hypothetical protein
MALDLPLTGRIGRFHLSTSEQSSTYDGDSLNYATGTGAVLMGGSYRQCDACGKRALSIAIRCPGCGREFPARQVPKSDSLELGRFLTPKAIAAVLAFVAVLVSARLGRAGQPTVAKAEMESSMARTGPQVESSMASTGPLETARVAAVLLDTGRVAAPPAESGSELRVVRSLTDVRQSRSVRAPLEAVLTPGDTVLADSLEQGWYRVALEGEVLGYSYRSTLAALR